MAFPEHEAIFIEIDSFIARQNAAAARDTAAGLSAELGSGELGSGGRGEGGTGGGEGGGGGGGGNGGGGGATGNGKQKPRVEDIIRKHLRYFSKAFLNSQCFDSSSAASRRRYHQQISRALECYIMSRLYDSLKVHVYNLCADEDAQLGHILDEMRDYTQAEVGMRCEFQCPVPLATYDTNEVAKWLEMVWWCVRFVVSRRPYLCLLGLQ